MVTSESRLSPELRLFPLAQRRLRLDLQRFGWSLALFWLVVGLLAVLLEAVSYLAPATRLLGLYLAGGLFAVQIIALAVLLQRARRQRGKRWAPATLAQLVRRCDPHRGEWIRIAQELESGRHFPGFSRDLIQATLDKGRHLAQQIDPRQCLPAGEERRARRRFFYTLALTTLLVFWQWRPVERGLNHWLHPGTSFPYPLPVSLQLQSDTTRVLAGDTLWLAGSISGRTVDEVFLHIESRTDTQQLKIELTNHHFRIPLENLRHSAQVYAAVENRQFWEPWQAAYSDTLIITVLDRPEIQNLTLMVHPPNYTGLSATWHSGEGVELEAPEGSRITIEGKASTELQKAQLEFLEHHKILQLKVEGTQFSGQIIARRSTTFLFRLWNQDSISNENPLQYQLQVKPDARPMVRVLSPGEDVVLGEDLILPLVVKLDDDYGFSRLELHYQRQSSLTESPDTEEVVTPIPFTPEGSTQQVRYTWDLNELGLMPEDIVVYWFEVLDNNTFSGPRRGRSRRWEARFPSLEEMYAAVDQNQAEVEQQTHEILEQLERAKEQVDELRLQALKDSNLSWEQKEQAKTAQAAVDSARQKLDRISRQLDEILKEAQKHQLFDDETLEKYSELQELFQELLTPELEEALRKLQQALTEQNPSQLQNALQNLQSEIENFKAGLERTLEVLKQVEIEQKAAELVNRLAQMAATQEKLSQQLEQPDQLNSNEAAAQEERLQREFQQTRQTAEELKHLLQETRTPGAEQVQDFQNQLANSEVPPALQQAQQFLQQGQFNQAQPPANRALQQLRSLAQQAAGLQQNLRSRMMEEVLSKFRQILLKTTDLSQAQEQLETTTRNTRYHSPRVRELAQRQNELLDELQQISQDLSALSKKTFAVSASIGRTLGKSFAAMLQSIQQLEQRNPSQAANSQRTARGALNEAARALISAMQSLQQGGQASGFDQYLEQLKQLAGQQAGLNQQTQLQLGLGKMSLLQQLAEAQLQLRRRLGKLQKRMGNDPRLLGDLNQIGKDMEEVARELKRRNPGRKVLEKQQRILSRLLDAQRSAHRRDYSRKRISKTATGPLRPRGPAVLPSDLGEKQNELYEALLYSLKQPYSPRERELIRNYFQALERKMSANP